jgi:hypothetical protein
MSIASLIQLLQQLQSTDLPQRLAAAGLPAGLEPMTAFTDAMLAAWVAFLAARLFDRSRDAASVFLWGCAFVAAAVSSLAGVAYHGSRILFSVAQTALCWKVVPVATGVAALCLGSAAAVAWLRPRTRKAIIVLLVLEFAACIAGAALSNSFMVAAIDYVPVLVALLAGALLHRGSTASGFIAAGVVVSFIAFGVQVSSLRLGGLDHNDIFHVIQAAAMYVLYRGGVLLGQPEPAYRAASGALAATGA